jgi:hypothetical protein
MGQCVAALPLFFYPNIMSEQSKYPNDHSWATNWEPSKNRCPDCGALLWEAPQYVEPDDEEERKKLCCGDCGFSDEI